MGVITRIHDGYDKDLAELEKAIEQLRKQQLELKAQKLKTGEYDPAKAKFLSEWLKDLYYLRNHHPSYKPKNFKRYNTQQKEAILFSDPELLNVTAKTDFKDPFEHDEQKTSDLVIELMDDLTTMEWEAVTMVWLQRLGPTEASRYMGCTVNNVSTYLLRARAKMLKKLNTKTEQMVISGFVMPPTVRRKRTVKMSKSTGRVQDMAKSIKQLTLF